MTTCTTLVYNIGYSSSQFLEIAFYMMRCRYCTPPPYREGEESSNSYLHVFLHDQYSRPQLDMGSIK